MKIQGIRPGIIGRGLIIFGFIAMFLVLWGCETTGDGITGNERDGGTVAVDGEPRGEGNGESDPNAGRFAALSFPERAEWVNVDTPLAMEELEGRYVLLDFWTYGCINCYHMIPNLNRLHERYDGKLVVIGVHSAKFTEEQDTRNIREAVERYDIRYPVINDRDMTLWRGYGIPGWPTIVLIDPDGYVVGATTGEWDYDRLSGLLDQTIDGDPDTIPPVLPQFEQAATTQTSATRLSFPQGLAYDENTGSLYVSDSGNNRIVRLDPDSGSVTAVWGTGGAGLRDGEAVSAQFNRPRGLAIHDGDLYVADTGNHAIRRVNIETGKVETIVRGGIGVDNVIRSPWDLAGDGKRLYFSNTGQHQIWTLDPESGETAVYAGTGYEGIVDGEADTAEFAQPSGISYHGGTLYVADPESSAVRAVDTEANGRVVTLAGTGLFDFGYRDGSVENAQLMHVGDVEYTTEGIVLADTYNNSLRLLFDGVVRTITQDLNEPMALATDGRRVWVADTNNHRIVQTDITRLSTGDATLDSVALRPGDGVDGGASVPISYRQDLARGSLRFAVQLPDGHKLNEESPNSLVFRGSSGEELVFPVASEGTERQTVTVPWTRLREAGVLDDVSSRQSVMVEGWFYYCLQENEEICRFFSTELQLLLEDDPGNSADATLPIDIG